MPDPAAEFRRRAQFVAAALLLAFPAMWAASYFPWRRPYDRAGKPLGGDFPVFHAFGKLGGAGGPALYDFTKQRAEQFAALPEMPPETYLPALYPPFVATALRPLAALPYPAAFGSFLFCGMALIAGTAWLWLPRLGIFRGDWRRTALLLVAGCPLAWEALLGGQASPVAFAAFGMGAALLAANDGRPTNFFLAGLLLGVGAYKPNLLLIPCLALAVRWPRLLAGMAASACGLALLGGLAEGWDAWSAYLRLFSDPATHKALGTPPLHKFHGLAAVAPFSRNISGRAVCGGLCLLAAVAVAWRWRRLGDDPRTNALALALIGTLGLLGNPYLPTYDLILIVPIGVLAASTGLRTPIAAAYLWTGAAYFGPHLSQEVAKATGWQPFSLLLVAFAAWLGRAFAARPLPAAAGSVTMPMEGAKANSLPPLRGEG